MLEFIKNLSGHSGCNIMLYKDNNKIFVRKTAGKRSYNERLQIQLNKQKSFNSDKFFAPKIYGEGYIGEIFYFDMEYLNCKTLASYMQNITVKEISKLVNLAINTLDIKGSETLPDTNNIFQKKINSLRSSFCHITGLENQAFQILENYDFSSIPHSHCHGDLTLENILITQEKKIYLIDFLDTFFDSWMIDVAKLLQDLEICRSYRHQNIDATLNLRLSIAKQALIESILELPNGQKLVSQIYYILLLNILRIIPYTKDEITKTFLQNALKKVITILDNNQF